MGLLEIKNLRVTDTLTNEEIVKGVNFNLEKNRFIKC